MEKKEWEDVEPTAWMPEEEGEEVIGILKKVEHKMGIYLSNLYTIESEKKERTTIYGSKILDERMEVINIGDEIKIVFKGVVKGKNQEYKDFKVYKNKAQVEPEAPKPTSNTKLNEEVAPEATI